jgi:hypothetical protein
MGVLSVRYQVFDRVAKNRHSKAAGFFASDAAAFHYSPQTFYRRQVPPLNYRIARKRRFSSLCLANPVFPNLPLFFFAPPIVRLAGRFSVWSFESEI